jgi:very-short-patch-repair endonuclease
VDLRTFADHEGGFITTRDLRAAGYSEHAVARALEGGELFRLKRGWYTSRHPASPEARAIAAGGRLTGASAIAALRGWVWRSPALLQVSVPANASRLTRVPGVQVHWEAPRVPPESPAIVGVQDALVRLAFDADLETAVAGFDWAMRSGRLDSFECERTMLWLPDRARVISRWIDERSQSILESVARTRLLRRGWSVRSQVRVGDLESIDLVVEDTVALELDGREFHESRFERDRRKDLAITLEGRHSIRVSRSMLVSDWTRVERAIEEALRARFVPVAGFSGVPLRAPRGSRRAPRPAAQNT